MKACKPLDMQHKLHVKQQSRPEAEAYLGVSLSQEIKTVEAAAWQLQNKQLSWVCKTALTSPLVLQQTACKCKQKRPEIHEILKQTPRGKTCQPLHAPVVMPTGMIWGHTITAMAHTLHFFDSSLLLRLLKRPVVPGSSSPESR